MPKAKKPTSTRGAVKRKAKQGKGVGRKVVRAKVVGDIVSPPVHWTEWTVHGVNPRGRRPANDPHEVIRAFECECDADGIGAVRIELLRSVATPSRY